MAMQGSIQQIVFTKILKEGVDQTVKFMGLLTEFHGAPTKTEYILTIDIARAFLARNFEVEVECLNRRFINRMTQRRNWKPRYDLGSTRTDVAVVEGGLIPRAIIEVKIGVGGTLTPIYGDLNKIAKTMEHMKPEVAATVQAASVFQVHVAGRANDLEIDRLLKKVGKIEKKLTVALENFAQNWPDFTFKFIPLQRRTAGIVATEIIVEDDGTESLGQNGHATRYYAILISSNRKPKKASTFRERLRGD